MSLLVAVEVAVEVDGGAWDIGLCAYVYFYVDRVLLLDDVMLLLLCYWLLCIIVICGCFELPGRWCEII